MKVLYQIKLEYEKNLPVGDTFQLCGVGRVMEEGPYPTRLTQRQGRIPRRQENKTRAICRRKE